MTMENATYPELRSFQHCRKDVDLVCFSLPAHCPLCGQDTAKTVCRIPPYVLPSPFSHSAKLPWSVVLKPTLGDFIRHYEPTCNLHIGVTDNNGTVYDFDEQGLNSGSHWPQCLAVASADPSERAQWEQTLSIICQQAKWRKDRYQENHWNCFDFALQFLEQSDIQGSDQISRMSKDDFCNIYLRQKTKRVEQYIHLYRQVLHQGCVVVNKPGS